MALLARNIHVKLNKCWYFGIMFCRDTPGDTSNVCACSVTSVMSGPVTPWILAHQALLSIGFSRKEYWSGLPCPPPGDLSDPRIEHTSLMSPSLAGGFFTTKATWEAPVHGIGFFL